MVTEACPYVSRGGLKLRAALDAFGVDVRQAVCADLGASIGGFTHCLIQAGAAKVYAVDTSYGVLAWLLRQDSRVVAMERVNALHFDPGNLPDFTGCSLVCLDMGWTRQAHAVPAALRWLRRDGESRIVTLIKPHYEVGEPGGRRQPGILEDERAEAVLHDVLEAMPALGVEVLTWIESPIRGGGRRHRRQGNREFLALLAPRAA